MTSFFDKLLTRFRWGPVGRSRMRRVLVQCERERARVELAWASQTESDQQRRFVVAIAQVRQSDFIVLGVSAQALAADDAVDINIVQANGRRINFRSKVLGACRIAEGKGERLSDGYRLALPSRMQVINQRRYFRVSLSGVERVGVALGMGAEAKPIRGVLHDLSIGGARVEIDIGVMPMEGTRVIMFAELPEPGGSIAEPARVVRVQRYQRTGRALIGLAFDEEAEALGPFIRHMEAQRTKHRHRAQHASASLL